MGAEEQEDGTRDTIVSISREGRLKAANWENGEKKQKKAGVTSARELFENDTSRLRAEARGHRGNVGVDLLEMMRLDEPESYAKFMELEQKAFELDFFSEEAYVYHRRAIVEVETGFIEDALILLEICLIRQPEDMQYWIRWRNSM